VDDKSFYVLSGYQCLPGLYLIPDINLLAYRCNIWSV